MTAFATIFPAIFLVLVTLWCVFQRPPFWRVVIQPPDAPQRQHETAYIVGTLDIRQDPPRLVAVNIYSARAEQVTTIFSAEFKFDIVSVDAPSFSEALEMAEQRLREYTHLAWAWRVYEAPYGQRIHERGK